MLRLKHLSKACRASEVKRRRCAMSECLAATFQAGQRGSTQNLLAERNEACATIITLTPARPKRSISLMEW